MRNKDGEVDVIALRTGEGLEEGADRAFDVLLILSADGRDADTELGLFLHGAVVDGERFRSLDEGICLPLPLDGVDSFVASYGVEEGRGRVTVVGGAAVAD